MCCDRNAVDPTEQGKGMTTYYKVTDENGKSCHGGEYRWALPDDEAPGDWSPMIPEPVVCQHGYHLTTEPGRWIKQINSRIFEAEPLGIDGADGDKIVTASARLIQETTLPYLERAKAFIATIKDVPFGKPDGKPDQAWCLFAAPTLAAARDAAWDAARDAAWAAARDAARDAAWDAARAAARDAAWAAARDAAWDAARAAARDAVLMVQTEIARDLNIDPKHIEYAEKRWEVYRKGYFVLCDVDGVLYVYAPEKA